MILTAEGQRQSAILTAEGNKQSAILNAEGDRESQILRAQADREAAILRAQGEGQAIQTVFQAIHDGQPDQALLAYQYLQMMPKIAEGDANKVWIIPTEITKALEGLGSSIHEIAGIPQGRRRAAHAGRHGPDRAGTSRARPRRLARRGEQANEAVAGRRSPTAARARANPRRRTAGRPPRPPPTAGRARRRRRPACAAGSARRRQ